MADRDDKLNAGKALLNKFKNKKRKSSKEASAPQSEAHSSVGSLNQLDVQSNVSPPPVDIQSHVIIDTQAIIASQESSAVTAALEAHDIQYMRLVDQPSDQRLYSPTEQVKPQVDNTNHIQEVLAQLDDSVLKQKRAEADLRQALVEVEESKRLSHDLAIKVASLEQAIEQHSLDKQKLLNQHNQTHQEYLQQMSLLKAESTQSLEVLNKELIAAQNKATVAEKQASDYQSQIHDLNGKVISLQKEVQRVSEQLNKQLALQKEFASLETNTECPKNVVKSVQTDQMNDSQYSSSTRRVQELELSVNQLNEKVMAQEKQIEKLKLQKQDLEQLRANGLDEKTRSADDITVSCSVSADDGELAVDVQQPDENQAKQYPTSGVSLKSLESLTQHDRSNILHLEREIDLLRNQLDSMDRLDNQQESKTMTSADFNDFQLMHSKYKELEEAYNDLSLRYEAKVQSESTGNNADYWKQRYTDSSNQLLRLAEERRSLLAKLSGTHVAARQSQECHRTGFQDHQILQQSLLQSKKREQDLMQIITKLTNLNWQQDEAIAALTTQYQLISKAPFKQKTIKLAENHDTQRSLDVYSSTTSAILDEVPKTDKVSLSWTVPFDPKDNKPSVPDHVLERAAHISKAQECRRD